nr:hypothetical protein [Nitrosomonas sp.]
MMAYCELLVTMKVSLLAPPVAGCDGCGNGISSGAAIDRIQASLEPLTRKVPLPLSPKSESPPFDPLMESAPSPPT